MPPCPKVPLALTLLATFLAPRPAAADAPRVWLADDGTRVRREDTGIPLSRGEGNPLWRPGAPARLGALRAEIVALQVIVEAGVTPLDGVKVELTPLVTSSSARGAELRIDRFVEHYVEVKVRSRNDRVPAESLGWSPGARPPDEAHLGFLPDALIPLDRAPPWSPYPLVIPARSTGAVWIDVEVPADAAPGLYTSEVLVTSAVQGELARIGLQLDVASAELPYRPVNFLAFYELENVAQRIGEGAAVEPQLWQLLHRHHVDAFGSLQAPSDVERLRPALDGSLFTEAHGYRGPGVGVPPGAVALGAYGQLGDPTPDALKRAEAITALVPPAVEDVMLYAVDEQCESPLGPGWRRLVQSSPLASRILVGHSCGNRNPGEQGVDLVMVPADHWRSDWARSARASGVRLWVYNGALPRSGTLMIDAPLTGLLADGWIAASYDIGRWFLWETTFWHDGNRGGKGPIDPFTTPENFHNRGGDACLGDGMLLYPGTQRDPFASHSVEIPGVLPSMRLKALRRGIQDAGYYALARAASPASADAILAKTIPAALDTAPQDAPPPWSPAGAPFFEARAALRALIPPASTLDRAAVAQVLAEAAAARQAARSLYGVPGIQAEEPAPGELAEGPPFRRLRRRWIAAAFTLTVLAAGILLLSRRRNRRS